MPEKFQLSKYLRHTCIRRTYMKPQGDGFYAQSGPYHYTDLASAQTSFFERQLPFEHFSRGLDGCKSRNHSSFAGRSFLIVLRTVIACRLPGLKAVAQNRCNLVRLAPELVWQGAYTAKIIRSVQ